MYMELRRRGYTVSVGKAANPKIDEKEIDCMRRVHTFCTLSRASLGALKKGMYPESNTLPKTTYPAACGDVDFIAENTKGKLYIQVCYVLANKETIEREFTPLLEIRDNYPKMVVTMDRLWQIERDGVKSIHLKDFLLCENISMRDTVLVK